MLQRRLYAALLAFLLRPASAGYSDSQSYLQPGLGLGLGRKESVQGILEHKPVKEPSCEQFVRALVLISFACSNTPFSPQAR